MIILSSKLLSFFLGVFHFKSKVEKSFQNPTRSAKSLFEDSKRGKYSIHEKQMNGKSIFTLDTQKTNIKNHIIFLHGGAYLIEGNSLHRMLIQNLLAKTNCRISYIDYPLAPEFNYKQTFEMLQSSYNYLVDNYKFDDFILIGDSAGGGLALSFAQKLVLENALKRPIKTILFSPWLDITMQNNAIKQQEKLDKLLPLQGLIEAGKKYAGGEKENIYLLSPLFGDLNNLGKILVFYGTHELFYPDCKALEAKSKTCNSNFIFLEYAEMQHDWVLFPIPEALKAINQTIDFIEK